MSLVTPIQRGIASAGASVSTTVAAVHLDKQVLLPPFIPLSHIQLASLCDFSRLKRQCLTIGNGYDVRAIYANHQTLGVRMVQLYSGCFHILQKQRGRLCYARIRMEIWLDSVRQKISRLLLKYEIKNSCIKCIFCYIRCLFEFFVIRERPAFDHRINSILLSTFDINYCIFFFYNLEIFF